MLATLLALVLAIDPARSSAQFTVEHIFVERVTGRVPIRRGSIDLAPGSMIPTSVTAELDASGVRTDDADRDASLRSPDWFDAQRYPIWTFASTKIVPSANGFSMEGVITIHGAAQSERLDVTIAGNPQRPYYHATCRIDRHAFGMRANRLDPVIGNVVDVTLDIYAR